MSSDDIDGVQALRDFTAKFPRDWTLGDQPMPVLYLSYGQAWQLAEQLNIATKTDRLKTVIEDTMRFAANFEAGDPTRLSNPLARKLLGEAGFLTTGEHVYTSEKNMTISVWTRGTELVTLHEHPNSLPVVIDREGKIMKWKDLGFRNPQIMEEGARDQG